MLKPEQKRISLSCQCGQKQIAVNPSRKLLTKIWVSDSLKNALAFVGGSVGEPSGLPPQTDRGSNDRRFLHQR